MSAQPVARVTPEEYLEADRAAEFRSEYFDGCAYAMSGSSYAHNRIAGNLFAQLWNLLRPRGCYVANSDMRVRVSPSVYTYPDITVTCDQPRLGDRRKDILLNPALIVEVLSPSTELHDRGLKFARYRQMDSLREYVLVSQTEQRVEIYQRADHGWLLSEHSGIESVIRFTSVDCEVAMKDIYENVEFESASEAAAE